MDYLRRRNDKTTRAKRNGVKSKYKNKPVELDGLRFASEAEAQYYVDLKEKKQKGEITDFQCQVPFTIQEGFISPSTGKKVRPIIYVADFTVRENNGEQTVIDVKGRNGFQTEVFKLKHKLFEHNLKIPLKIVMVEKRKKK